LASDFEVDPTLWLKMHSRETRKLLEVSVHQVGVQNSVLKIREYVTKLFATQSVLPIVDIR